MDQIGRSFVSDWREFQLASGRFRPQENCPERKPPEELPHLQQRRSRPDRSRLSFHRSLSRYTRLQQLPAEVLAALLRRSVLQRYRKTGERQRRGRGGEDRLPGHKPDGGPARQWPADLQGRGRRHTCWPSRPAEPGPCRCYWWPSHVECAAPVSAKPGAGAKRLWRSRVTPTIRPGTFLLNFSLVAKKAACGPPNPRGTPKRWEFPITTSAPNSPGGLRRQRLKRSVARNHEGLVTVSPCRECLQVTQGAVGGRVLKKNRKIILS